MSGTTAGQPPVNINALLRSLRPPGLPTPPAQHVSADEIAFAVSNIFTNELSPVQIALLLYTLSLTGLEQRPDVLAKCAEVMREAAVPVDIEGLKQAVKHAASKRKRGDMGSYEGGLCDIVGTGGDYHSTFNISTASSILASSLLVVAKHGNRASTSKSGSADVLALLPFSTSDNDIKLPHRLDAVTPTLLPQIYSETNYCFLFAPNFHTGMRHAASVRKEIPNPTIFNLLGPIANPVHAFIEARVVGVKKKDLVPVFAEALRLSGTRKGMVVCGDEDLDEISCAGITHCARLVDDLKASSREGEDAGDHDPEGSEVRIERFTLSPVDFGLPEHPLSSVSPGLTPQENAGILARLIAGELKPEEEPILNFVLLNTAALLVISGVTEGQQSAFEGDQGAVITEVGPGGGRWKEGARLARLAVTSGRAREEVKKFVEIIGRAAKSSV